MKNHTGSTTDHSNRDSNRYTKNYLDYNATTPVDPRVLEKMQTYFCEKFGNPASVNHEWGWAAESAVEKARSQVAKLLKAKTHEIYFTSGATESNNWTFFGLVRQWQKENPQQKIHIITSSIEHNSILQTVLQLQTQNIEVDILPVDSVGRLSPETVAKAIKPHTKLLSAIWVNNEIGTINGMNELGQLARRNSFLFHSDATQALGKISMDMSVAPIDLMSFSGHKIYGPKGVGGLFVRSHNPAVTLQPLLFGGGHENGLRSGTLNVPGIVGLGEACEIAATEFAADKARICQLRDDLWTKIQQKFPKTKLNGPPILIEGPNQPPSPRIYNSLNLTFPGLNIQACSDRLSQLGISTGSACTTGRMEISHVLKGIGLDSESGRSTLRISLGRFSTEEDIHNAMAVLESL